MSKENGDDEVSNDMTETTEDTSKEENSEDVKMEEDEEVAGEEAEEEEEDQTNTRRLKRVTAMIGPLKLMDIQSTELSKVLGLSDNFSIQFDLREFQADEDNPDVYGEEKLGYATVPFEIYNENFLLSLFHKLKNLNIKGRVMNVSLPEEFTTEVERIRTKKHNEKMKADEKRRQEQLAKKRFIYMTNLPATVEEETVRSLFPEVISVTDVTEGDYRYIKLEFVDHEVAQKCLDENKDVEIGEKSVKLARYPPSDRGINKRTIRDSRHHHDRHGDKSRQNYRSGSHGSSGGGGGSWSKQKPSNKQAMMGGYGGDRSWGSSAGGQRGYSDNRGGGLYDQRGYMGKPNLASYNQLREYTSGHPSGYRGGYSGQGKRKSEYDGLDRGAKRPYGGGGSGRNMNYDNYGGYGGGGGGGGYGRFSGY